MWQQFQQASLNAWAKTMSETITGEDFARAVGQSLDSYLDATAPLREQVEKVVEQYLQQMKLPTRDEVVTLAERLTRLEMRIDDLDAKMDEGLDRLKAIQAQLASTESGEEK